MFDGIFSFISIFWDYFRFWWVIEQYNKGVKLRWGKFNKVLEPGLHWKRPFADFVVETTVVPTTMRLPSQSLTTLDGKSIVLQAVIKYEISDVRVFLMEVNDAVDAIGDMTQAIIKTILTERTWEQCRSTEIDTMITKKARVEAKKWGIDIIQVTISDLGIIRSIRLIGDTGILT